jgi:hypothetical protein
VAPPAGIQPNKIAVKAATARPNWFVRCTSKPYHS